MKLANKSLMLCVSLMITLASCVSEQQQPRAELSSLTPPKSVLLYENPHISSGATDECLAAALDQWYASQNKFSDLVTEFERQLPAQGWTLGPEDSSRIWRKQTQEGLFSLYLGDYSNRSEIEFYEMDNGPLPKSLVQEAAQYTTLFVVHVSFMQPEFVKSCFGK